MPSLKFLPQLVGLLSACSVIAAPMVVTPNPEQEAYQPAGSAVPAEGAARSAWMSGRAYLGAGALDEAEKAFLEALRTDPKAYAPMLGMADAAVRRGDLKAADEWMTKAQRAGPQSAEVAAAAGRLAAAQGRQADAERELRRAIQLDLRFATPRLDLAESLMAVGRLKEAAEQFKATTVAVPSHPGAMFGLGRALAALGDLPAAQRAFEESARLAPQMSAPIIAWAEVLGAQRRFAEAHKVLEPLLQRSAVPVQARVARVGLLDAEGRHADAIAEQQRIVAQAKGPDVAAAWLRLGTLQERSGRIDDAEAAYRKAIEADPKFHLGWNNLAWLAVGRQKGWDQALADVRKALELSPGNATYLDTLGALQLGRGDLAGAVESFRQAAKAAPNSPLAHFRLAHVLDKQGQARAAADAYAAALALKRPFAEEAAARSRLAELSGQKSR